MKLTDKLETLLACLPESPFKQHLREEIEAIESTVRQDAEHMVRELVEALEYMLKWGHCPAADEKARAALTHAQQRLEAVAGGCEATSAHGRGAYRNNA